MAKVDDTDGPVLDAINLDELTGLSAISPELRAAGTDAAQKNLAQLGSFADSVDQHAISDAALAYAQARSAELVTEIDDSTREMLRSLIGDALAEGKNYQDIADLIEQSDIFSEKRADLIAETEVRIAHGNGILDSQRAARDAGLNVKKEWQPDSDPCEDCQDNADAGPIDIDDDFPSGDDTTPAHPRCLPGSALVLPCGDVAGVSKRWFEGNLVIINVAGGIKLSCTENHPVLTPHGWVAAGLLNEGDEVISCGISNWVRAIGHNRENMPTSIEQVAEAFGRSSSVSSREVPVSAPDFHGDGEGSKIAVIFSDGELLNKVVSARSHHISENGLKVAGVGAFTHYTNSPLDEEIIALGNATHRSVSSADLGSSLIGSISGPSDQTGSCVAPDFNSSLNQSAPDNATTNIQPLGDSLLTFPGLVGCDDGLGGKFDTACVVDVHTEPFAGYVYNLQTTASYYIAQGVIVHNCECAVLTVIVQDNGSEEEGDEE